MNIQKCLLFAFIALVLWGVALYAYSRQKPLIRQNIAQEIRFRVIADNLDYKLSLLAQCESGGHHHAFNDNDGAQGLHSYGVFQFQPPTFYAYWKKLVNPEIEKAEVMNLIWDADAQWLLARKMLEDDKNNWTHWKICGKRVGLNLL